jgi:hypothetical protein
MKEKYIARKDKKLLVHAKMIFGNVVEEAYKSSAAPPFEDLVNDYLDFEITYDKKLKELDYSSYEILLKFSSGKYVWFSNSEWAKISAVDMDEVKVYD